MKEMSKPGSFEGMIYWLLRFSYQQDNKRWVSILAIVFVFLIGIFSVLGYLSAIGKL